MSDKPLKVARLAARKITDAKMASVWRRKEIAGILEEASKTRRRLDNAELLQMLILTVSTLSEIENILDTIEAVSE